VTASKPDPTKALHIATIALVASLALVSPGAAASAQVATDWREIPTPPLRVIEIPEPKRLALDNGVVFFLQEDRELPLIRGTVIIRGGSREEPAAKTGMVSIYGQAWRTGGTSTRTGDELDDFLEARAAVVETHGGTDSTRLTWDSLAQDFDDVFAVALELLHDPAFREDKIALAKNQLNTGIARRNDDIEEIADREANRLAYGAGSPYARVPEYDTVTAVTREDLVAWHQRWVHPNHIVVGVVGDFDAADMEARLQQALGGWPRGPEAQAPEIPIEPEPPGIYFVQKDDVTQSQIRMVHLGIRRDHPDYVAVQVLNEIFGGGFAARLFSRIRSDQGLAYRVRGGVGSAYDRPGAFRIVMGTRSETTLAGIRALQREIDLLLAEPVGADELARAQESILNSFVFNLDSHDKVLQEKLTLERYGYPLDFLERYRQGVEAVTVEEVSAAARRHIHPDRIALLVVGKREDFDGDLAELGPMTEIDIAIPPPATARQEAITGDAEGEELMSRVVAGLGGEERIATVSSVRRAGSVTMRTPQGEMSLGLDTLEVFPDRVHQTMRSPMGEMTLVVSPQEAFMVMAGQTQELPSSQKEDTLATLSRAPLWVARRLGDPAVTLSAAGTKSVGDVAAELLDVDVEGSRVRWYVDSETGRILRSVYMQTGPAGPQERIDDYSDFREVDGLRQPFRIDITMGGEPSGQVELETIEVNPEIDDELFARPQ
jgi:zinc protease